MSSDPIQTPVVQVVNHQPAPGAVVPFTQQGGDLATRSTIDMRLNQEDLVHIMVSKGESAIRARIAELQRLVRTAETNLTAANKAVNDYLTSWTRTKMLADVSVSLLVNALSSFNGSRYNATPDPAIFNELTQIISGTVALVPDSGAHTLSKRYSESASDEFLALRSSALALSAEVARLKTETLHARSALNNIDAMERRAKAEIASNLASRTPEGAALVDNLGANIDAQTLIDQLRI